MDWLVSKPHFTRGDAKAFKFYTEAPFEISAISIQRAENVSHPFFMSEDYYSNDVYISLIHKITHRKKWIFTKIL